MNERKWYKTTGVIDDDNEVIMHAFMSVCACSSQLPVTAGSATTLMYTCSAWLKVISEFNVVIISLSVCRKKSNG